GLFTVGQRRCYGCHDKGRLLPVEAGARPPCYGRRLVLRHTAHDVLREVRREHLAERICERLILGAPAPLPPLDLALHETLGPTARTEQHAIPGFIEQAT